MPEEDYWESFFDADCIIKNLEWAKHGDESVVELGCGYGNVAPGPNKPGSCGSATT